jgi:xyloglucan:xyloglucosyl transferase
MLFTTLIGYDYRFYVDNVPIRVFKNNRNIGVDYPSKPMNIEASLWDGDSWATDGGQTKTNWSYAPFKAHFQGFDISGCPVQNSDVQQRSYDNVRKKYVNYDYCSDRPRYPTPPPECLHQ